jgi:hypothetical protein
MKIIVLSLEASECQDTKLGETKLEMEYEYGRGNHQQNTMIIKD